MIISDIKALEILDSRGFPTIEVTVTLAEKYYGTFCVPSGASKGKKESLELRDESSAFRGKGVKKAIKNIETTIKERLINKDITNQFELDDILIALDGTANKSNLGANAILAVSMAFAKCCADYHNKPFFAFVAQQNNFTLPIPLVNIINGGAHANNLLSIQEFMIVPVKSDSFANSLAMVCEVFYALKDLIKAKGFSVAVGDEGGFAPNISNPYQALDLIISAIDKASLKPKEDILLALDVAANELWRPGLGYNLIGNEIWTLEQTIEFYKNICNSYPIFSIEDPLHEDDIKGWQLITKELGSNTQIVGDDIFVTNKTFLASAADQKIANAILIKPNQVGTLTETIDTIKTAKLLGYNTIMSHRSGETEDTTIADLAVGLGTNQIKTGSVCRGERTTKYNQLLRIEKSLKNF
jgi:enolase